MKARKQTTGDYLPEAETIYQSRGRGLSGHPHLRIVLNGGGGEHKRQTESGPIKEEQDIWGQLEQGLCLAGVKGNATFRISI